MITLSLAPVPGHRRVTLDVAGGRVTKRSISGGDLDDVLHEATVTNLARRSLAGLTLIDVLEARVEQHLLTTTLVEHAVSLEDLLRSGQQWVGWATLGEALAHLHHQPLPEPAPVAMPERPVLPPLTIRGLQAAPWMALRCIAAVDIETFIAAASHVAAAPPVRGLIHGDLKPDNVLLANGRTYLLDWERGGAGAAEDDLAAPLAAMLTYRLVIGYRDTLDGGSGLDVLRQAWNFTSDAASDLLGGYRRHAVYDPHILNLTTGLKLFARAQMLAYKTSHVSPVVTLLLRAGEAFAGGRAGWAER